MIANDVNYFSSSEQDLMMYTEYNTIDANPIDANDERNKINYILRDKLYVPNKITNKHISVGSNDSIVLSLLCFGSKPSYPYNHYFWLRTPEAYWGQGCEKDVLCVNALTESYKNSTSVTTVDFDLIDVRPVFDLNLESVLFSSAVPAFSGYQTGMESGSLDFRTPMRLRHASSFAPQSSVVKSATVSYDTTGNIYVSGAESPVILVVQCRYFDYRENDYIDWYYSKYIESSLELTKQLDWKALCQESMLGFYPCDFSKCKIWLETEMNTDRMIYATDPNDTSMMTVITSVDNPSDITNIDNGKTKEYIKGLLPHTVGVTLSPSSSTITTVTVQWDVDSSTYNPSKKSAQTFTINGTLTLPDGILNPDDIVASVSVTVNSDNQYSEPGPETNHESQPNPQPQPGDEANPQPQPGDEANPQPQPGDEANPQPQPGPEPNPQPQPGDEANPQPQPEPEPNPEPTPNTDSYYVKTVTMLRLYNPNSGEHFYTSSEREKKALVKQGWNYEGIAWEGPSWSNTPVYRLYNESAGDHHYTTSKKERDNLVKAGWKDEGIGWYSDDAKTTPLYRLYNPNAVTGSHHYTTSARERDKLVKQGWKDEGIGWYGL